MNRDHQSILREIVPMPLLSFNTCASKDLLQLYNVSFQFLTDDWQDVVQVPDKHLYSDVLKWSMVR